MIKTQTQIESFNKVPDYNGYTNKPTWLVSLWINNEQGLQETVIQEVKAEKAQLGKDDAYLFAGWLENFIQNNSPLVDKATLYSDLLGWALAFVDWDELAEHFIETAKEI